MAGRYKVTARIGPKVRRERFDTLEDALDALSRELELVGAGGDSGTRRVLGREYTPVSQVAGRFELAGPDGLRGGVDVRGDGSAEAYRGWIRKRLLERQSGESAVDVLRRELGS